MRAPSSGLPDRRGLPGGGHAGRPMRWLTTLLVLLIAALVSACSGGDDGDSPEPGSAATTTATTTAMPGDGALAGDTATRTPTPTATATPSPSPDPTPNPTPAAIPSEPAVIEAGRSVLWSGATASSLLWASLRLTPGTADGTTPWVVELGDLSVTRHECRRVDDGGLRVELGGCSELEDGEDLSISVDLATIPPRMEFRITESTGSGLRTRESTLTPVETRDEAPSRGTAELWVHRDTTLPSHTDVWSADGIVFAPHFGGAIELLDITTGERLSVIDAGSSVLDVKARDGLLVAATTQAGVRLFDVSDPVSPQRVGQIAVLGGASPSDAFLNVHNVYLSPIARVLYAINHSHPGTDLRIFDIADPSEPAELGRYVVNDGDTTLEGAHDVHVIERDGRLIAFLNALSSGLLILDVTDPAAITVISATSWPGIFSHSGWYWEDSGGQYYLHADEGPDQSLTVLDVSDLASPRVIGNFATRPGISVHNVEIVDSVAYVSYYIDGLRVLSLDDPAVPFEIAHHDTVADDDERDILQGAWGVHVDGDTVLISDRTSGIVAVTLVPAE